MDIKKKRNILKWILKYSIDRYRYRYPTEGNAN